MILPTNPGSASDSVRAEPRLGGRLSAWLAAPFLESYVRWRDACHEVRIAYERWGTAERSDRALAFAAYRGALDREECAARAHSHCTELLRARAR
jgi:hypothetical protein